MVTPYAARARAAGRHACHTRYEPARAAEQGDPCVGVVCAGAWSSGSFLRPNRASVLRLVGMILAEQDDEWQDGRRYFRPETMAAIDAVPLEEVGQALLMAS
jgi:hypothetical protein